MQKERKEVGNTMQEAANVETDTTRPTMYVPEMRALQIVETIKTCQKKKEKNRRHCRSKLCRTGVTGVCSVVCNDPFQCTPIEAGGKEADT
jgi:hypothetical protein